MPRQYWYGYINEDVAPIPIASDFPPPPRIPVRERLDAIKICQKILNGHPTVESVYTRLRRFSDPEIQAQHRIVQACIDSRRMDLLQMLNSRFEVNMNNSFVDSVTGTTVKNATPLIRVAERGDELMARLLVRNLGADPNHVAMNPGTRKECSWPEIGNTAVLAAINAGNESMVRLLVQELGADVNLKSPSHMRFHYSGGILDRSEVVLTYTPLLFAIEKENSSMVILLLTLGADPFVRGWTRAYDHTFICGNALQLAEIRFEDREPIVINELRRVREQRTNVNTVTTAAPPAAARDNATLDEANISQRLSNMKAKLDLHLKFLGRVRKHIECNICLDIPVSAMNIYICENSHNFCHACIDRVNNCPLCKVSFLTTRPIRNRLAESVVVDLDSFLLREIL